MVIEFTAGHGSRFTTVSQRDGRALNTGALYNIPGFECSVTVVFTEGDNVYGLRIANVYACQLADCVHADIEVYVSVIVSNQKKRPRRSCRTTE
jgi:hypothetical protein